MSSWLPAERRQPGPCTGLHMLGHHVTCHAAWGRDAHADSSTRVPASIEQVLPLPRPHRQGKSHTSLLAGTLLDFAVVMDVPPRDSHGKGKA